MYTLRFFHSVCIFLLISSAFAQSSDVTVKTGTKEYKSRFTSDLPKCAGEDPSKWTLCVGTFKFGNGNIYTGEWHNGMREGNGELRIVAKGKTTTNYIGSDIPATYTGEFMRNKINGRGKIVLDTGEKTEGDFVDNMLVVKK